MLRVEVIDRYKLSSIPCAWEVFEEDKLVAKIYENGMANAVELKMAKPVKVQFLGDLAEDHLTEDLPSTTVYIHNDFIIIKSIWSDVDILPL